MHKYQGFSIDSAAAVGSLVVRALNYWSWGPGFESDFLTSFISWGIFYFLFWKILKCGSHMVGTASLAPRWSAPLRDYPAAAAAKLLKFSQPRFYLNWHFPVDPRVFLTASSCLRWSETKKLKISIPDNICFFCLIIIKLCTFKQIENVHRKLKLKFS